MLVCVSTQLWSVVSEGGAKSIWVWWPLNMKCESFRMLPIGGRHSRLWSVLLIWHGFYDRWPSVKCNGLCTLVTRYRQGNVHNQQTITNVRFQIIVHYSYNIFLLMHIDCYCYFWFIGQFLQTAWGGGWFWKINVPTWTINIPKSFSA